MKSRRRPEISVKRYSVFEDAFTGGSHYANPYKQVETTVAIARPDGREWEIPLFWDGGDVWKMRISPDSIGRWSYKVRSSDLLLNGKAGSFECRPSDLHGGIMPMNHFPFHFQYQDGTPFWFFGDTGWRTFASNAEKKLNRTTVLHYIDVRAEQGFNYIHVDLTGGGGNEGEQKLMHNYPDEILNQAFFQEVDYRLAYMNGKGITCGILLAWSIGRESWSSFSSNEARLRFTRYIVARYSAYNVVFIVCGEWDKLGEDKKPIYQSIGREIMRADCHQRMRAIHPGEKRSTQEFAGESWMSFGDYQQMYCAPMNREATASERSSLRNNLLMSKVTGKPVVNSEYAYFLREMNTDHSYIKSPIKGVDKPHSHTRVSFRRASWVLAMAGGYFVSGFGTTYYGGWRDMGSFNVDAPKNDEAEADLMRIREFFNALQWWKLQVMDSLVRSKEGYCYCLAELGKIYVVYFEGTTEILLSTDGPPVATYLVSSYDPRKGKYSEHPEQNGAGTLILVAPDLQDWVFLVTLKEAEQKAMALGG